MTEPPDAGASARTVHAMSDIDRMARRILDKGVREVYVFAPDTLKISYANENALQHTGYSGEDLTRLTPLDLMPALSREALESIIAPLRAGAQEVALFEAVQRRRDDTTYPVEVALRLLSEGGQAALVAYVADITQSRAQEEQLRHLAYHDALTGLPNRTLLQERLQQALAQADRSGSMLALMFLDLDRFKVINDTLGHRTGDQLLAATAERLAACVRRSDTVARLGGDEFAMVQPGNTQAEEAALLAERVVAAFARPFNIDGRQLFLGASVGITVYPGDAGDVHRLFQNADLAMYRAKEQGGNQYQFYTPAMNAAVQERLVLESDLRQGLERAEFVLHYQPVVDLHSGEVVGAEALLRWQHPERGLLLPDKFLPIAEDTGLMMPIGEWVLTRACAQNSAWQRAGLPPLLMAVNLSALQLRQPNLPAVVQRALEAAGLEPPYLELELTENTGDPANLEPLHRMGVKLAIDDVGTGNSPLSSLKGFPVHKVKIDQAFVRDLVSDSNSAAMTRGIIALAHSLRLTVVAEGVETPVQLEFLRRNRCDSAQGFYFSRAVPAEAFDRLLRETVRSSAGLAFGGGSPAGVWAFWSRQPRAAA